MLPSSPQVAVMEFGKRHDTADFCPCQLVMDLLWGSNRETGVMDFGLDPGCVSISGCAMMRTDLFTRVVLHRPRMLPVQTSNSGCHGRPTQWWLMTLPSWKLTQPSISSVMSARDSVKWSSRRSLPCRGCHQEVWWCTCCINQLL